MRKILKTGNLTALLFILTVSASPLAGRTLYLAPDGNDSAPYAHGAVFATIFRALDSLSAGDTLIVRNGVYRGGLIASFNGTAEKPILIRGESLDAVIDSSRNGYDAIRLDHCSHVTVDRLTLRRANRAGLCIINCNHITVTGCRMANNGKWGILTGWVDDFRAEGNECYGAKDEHGIYHSNSGDRFVIRGNYLHDNAANGIHLNGDPELPGDGVMNYGVVENNIICRNGGSGGAGINMTHVHDVLVRNNLIWNNYAGGFTVYQDDTAPEHSSQRVVITGNTVWFKANDRNVVNIAPTSSKVVVAGNILSASSNHATLEVNSDHLSTILSDWNIHWNADTTALVSIKERSQKLSSWVQTTGNDKHSKIANPLFTRPDSGDFNLAAGSPALDSGVPRDSLRAMLTRLGGCEWLLARLDSLPYEDIRGTWRPVGAGPDAGAYEMGMSEAQRFDFDGNGMIDRADAPALVRMIRDDRSNPRCDFNQDGKVGLADILGLLLALAGR